MVLAPDNGVKTLKHVDRSKVVFRGNATAVDTWEFSNRRHDSAVSTHNALIWLRQAQSTAERKRRPSAIHRDCQGHRGRRTHVHAVAVGSCVSQTSCTPGREQKSQRCTVAEPLNHVSFGEHRESKKAAREPSSGVLPVQFSFTC